jgi:adenosylmethionine-8-amino-7-oxononanoate aminotransferase
MFGPLVPGFVQTAAPWTYRYPDVDAAAALEQTILAEGAQSVAAFIAEPVMGAGGVIVPPDDYFPRVGEICARHEVLLIADEVITGFGRTGKTFALEHWRLEPDIMSFAKGITSGYVPLGGIMVSDEIAKTIRSGSGGETWMHAYTYSGHPTCCAVGLANLDVMAREGLVERAADTGAYLQKKLKELEQLPNADDARGLGMMAAVELVEDKSTRQGFPAERGVSARALQLAAEKGLITRQRHYGSGEMIMVAPPLVTTREQVDRIVQILAESIEEAVKA